MWRNPRGSTGEAAAMRPKSLRQVFTERWRSSLKRAKHVLRLEIRAGFRWACIWMESKWTPQNIVCWEGERTLFLMFVLRPRAWTWQRTTSLWQLTDSLEWARKSQSSSNWVHENPGASMGPEQHPCILWTSSAPKLGQREEPFIDKPSLQKQTEGTSCAAGQPECENRHLSGRQWQTSLPLKSET